MKGLLDLLERVAPNVALFPRWAKSLFVTTLAAVALSLVVYAALHDSALRTREAAAESRDVTVDLLGSTGTRRGLLNGQLAKGVPARPSVTYVSDDDGTSIRIRPRAPYPAAVAAGGPLRADTFTRLTAADLPLLDLRIANNSNRVVYVSEAIVQVESSRPDPTVLPVLNSLEFTARSFRLGNEGWGPMEQPVLRYRILERRSEHAFERPFPSRLELPTVRSHQVVDVSEGLSDVGVDLATVRRLEHRDAVRGRSPELRRALRPFRRDHGFVFGELSYTTGTLGGRHVRRHVLVETPILFVEPPPMVSGSFIGSSSVYNLELLPSGRDYRRVVGLSERLRPHDVDRFQIRVYAPRSSVHRFRVHLRYGSHEASARETELRIYVPRSNEEPQLQSEADLAPA